MPAKILLLTGMTPDARIFERLVTRLPHASVVAWIAPLPHESIPDYVERLADSIPVRGDVIVCGVSFGGVVARELAVRLNAKACVLISSVRSEHQLPPWIRALRPLAHLPLEGLLSSIGMAACCYPCRLRTDGTARLTKLGGASGAWHRWATTAILRWQASPALDTIPLLQIHGERDRTFPVQYVSADVVIAGGGHVLPLTHAEQIATLLSRFAA